MTAGATMPAASLRCLSVSQYRRYTGHSTSGREGRQQGEAAWPVSEAALPIDVPQGSDLHYPTSPFKRLRVGVVERAVWIV